MKTLGHDIGKGLSIWMRFLRSENEAHADINVVFAPSECHDLARRGFEKRLRVIRRLIKATTGLKFGIFERECRRRTSSHVLHKIGV